ncbi:hypothetical protein MCL26_17165 [Acinetobacter pittii]|uniref:phosphorylase family protein n=1 Tax=Acinetobacter pittii TaxID=48296 RepID=UPI001EFD5721|nr:hypothetical protein [Acinetobacter pittii]MCG9516829.1 hypothetical protein [Acinetobacter pittii]WPP69468.1 hypothetical protein SOI81_14005 [Acinetobacter pittii]
MQVLLIDDDESKINRLKDFLISQKINEKNILISRDAADARKKLAIYNIDLMLLDVLLPVRQGAKASGEHSIELLRQIVEDGVFPAPKNIIGITASEEALKQFNSEFRGVVTQVLHISPEFDDWKQILHNFIEYLKRVEVSKKSFEYDVVVLNALRKPELEAVYNTWDLTLSDECLVGSNIACRKGIMSIAGRELKVACAHLSQMGPIAATHTTEYILNLFKPRILIMTGICGGFSDSVELGDVVIADKSWDWQAGKWVEDWSLLSALDPKDASSELVTIARTIDSDMQNFYQEYTKYRPEKTPKLVTGPMVTGSSVVASQDIQKVFKSQHRKMCAIDMECYGLYYSCANHAGLKTKFICIKSVSDLADREKADNFHEYCSYMSARVGMKLVEKYFLSI